MDLTLIENDFTQEERDKVQNFISNGLPGLANVVSSEDKVMNLFSLYMEGKTYGEISQICRVKKDIVLYISAKGRWYSRKSEYMTDLQKNITNKLIETKSKSLNFIADLINVHHKYYGDKMNEFLATGNKSIIDDIDFKQLAPYFKSIEILEKILGGTASSSSPIVNVNVQGETKIDTDGKTVNIDTSKDVGKLLKALAEHKEAIEKSKNN